MHMKRQTRSSNRNSKGSSSPNIFEERSVQEVQKRHRKTPYQFKDNQSEQNVSQKVSNLLNSNEDIDMYLDSYVFSSNQEEKKKSLQKIEVKSEFKIDKKSKKSRRPLPKTTAKYVQLTKEIKNEVDSSQNIEGQVKIEYKNYQYFNKSQRGSVFSSEQSPSFGTTQMKLSQQPHPLAKIEQLEVIQSQQLFKRDLMDQLADNEKNPDSAVSHQSPEESILRKSQQFPNPQSAVKKSKKTKRQQSSILPFSFRRTQDTPRKQTFISNRADLFGSGVLFKTSANLQKSSKVLKMFSQALESLMNYNKIKESRMEIVSYQQCVFDLLKIETQKLNQMIEMRRLITINALNKKTRQKS